MKHKEIAEVLSQESIGAGIYSMWLKCPLVAGDEKEGQFISLYCHDGAKILPRPISICEINKEEGTLRIVYRVVGGGTEEFSTYSEGTQIEILGPLGNGFTLQPEKTAMLIAGGIGIPPMVQTARRLKEEGCKEINIVVGYRNAETFLIEELSAYGNVIIGEARQKLGSWVCPVAPGWGICLPVQGTRVRSLVWGRFHTSRGIQACGPQRSPRGTPTEAGAARARGPKRKPPQGEARWLQEGKARVQVGRPSTAQNKFKNK